MLTAALLLLLLGAAGKSAQIPLYVWLPDAMAGPTPVSALIHAATMVTAGVYLFCRLSFLLVLSPTAMAWVAMIGAVTALWAALIAFAQDDIKKVLAYSTVSQLGFMFMGVGVGVFWAAALHLITHAFFKACLFLGAGSVMHGNGDETDIQQLGGLRKEMPWTWATFAIATLAITGIAPLSGFFSKDAILHGAHTTEVEGFHWLGHTVYGIGLLAALCTAFYMTRLYVLTFEGKRAADARLPHAHESGVPMVLTLVVLAALSVLGGCLGRAGDRRRSGLEQAGSADGGLSGAGDAARRPRGHHLQDGGPRGELAVAGVRGRLGGGAHRWRGGVDSSTGTGCHRGRASRSRHGSPRPGAGRGTSSTWTRCTTSSSSGRSPPSPTACTRWSTRASSTASGCGGTAVVLRKLGGWVRYTQTGNAQNYATVMAVGLLVSHRRRPDLGAPMTATLSPWLVTLVVFQPLLAAVVVALLPQNEKRLVRGWTFVALLVNFGLTVLLYAAFEPRGAEFQLEQRVPWISELGISYHVGVDGLAVSLMLLTGFLGPLVVLASWRFIDTRVKELPPRAAAHPDRDARRPGGAGRHPLLRLLRGDAHPDVPDHRGVGLGGAGRRRR